MIKKLETKEPLDDEFEGFLSSMKQESAMTYRSAFKHWLNFSGLNGKASVEFAKADTDALTEKKIAAFKQYLTGLGKSENSAKTACGAIRGFYASKRIKLAFTPAEKKKIQEANRTTEDYRFVLEDFRKMWEQANLQEKWILANKAIGMRASDFLVLTWGRIRASHPEGEAPISLGKVPTQKEHVPAFPFMDSDAQSTIKAMLERSPQAENSAKILDLNEHSLSLTVQRLFKQAHLESGGTRVRFHGLRAFCYSALTSVASDEQAKQIVGKKVSEAAYLNQEQLRDIYTRAMSKITINGNSKNHAAIEEIATKIADMSKKIGDQSMEIKGLQDRDEARTKDITEFKAEFRDELNALAEQLPEPRRTKFKSAVTTLRTGKGIEKLLKRSVKKR
jgi:hypothetical protein